MSKVSIVPLDKAVPVSHAAGFCGDGETHAYLDRHKDPIHVHRHHLDEGGTLVIGPMTTDSMVYVWEGEVEADGHVLRHGSSLLIEHGAKVELASVAAQSVLVRFASGHAADAPRGSTPQVHLMPTDDVPRYQEGASGGNVAGGLHADASLASCPVWLHENMLPAPAQQVPRTDPDVGVHAHGEDEVIFVTAGNMQLGARIYGPGTLLAIAADTMYSFGVGPDGLKFVNFRPGMPDQIKFKNGMLIDEVGYWRSRVAPPRYVSFAGAFREAL